MKNRLWMYLTTSNINIDSDHVRAILQTFFPCVDLPVGTLRDFSILRRKKERRRRRSSRSQGHIPEFSLNDERIFLTHSLLPFGVASRGIFSRLGPSSSTVPPTDRRRSPGRGGATIHHHLHQLSSSCGASKRRLPPTTSTTTTPNFSDSQSQFPLRTREMWD